MKRSATKNQRATALEGDWRDWLTTLFPDAIRDLAPHHEAIFDWLWAIERDARPQPLVAILARGGGKSTIAEIAAVSVGARGLRGYGLYVCHEIGTNIFDFEYNRWMKVEEHPTAEKRVADGITVRLWGLPFPETVTPEHQYWGRRITRRDLGHGRPCVHTITEPGWIEAQALDTHTWLGLPIDQTTDEHFPLSFADPEWWWFVGLWWGDGTLGGPVDEQFSIYVADTQPEIFERLTALLTRHGYHWGSMAQPSGGCSRVYFSYPALATHLREWRGVGNSQKCPPAWVERLPVELQANLIRGYVDADGHITSRDVNVTSVSLPGLLATRRILARIGIPATIKPLRPARREFIQGRECDCQAAYALRFQQGASLLGYPVEKMNKWRYQAVFIEDGHLWSRVRKTESAERRFFVPIVTATHDYLTAFARSHNCSTQEQADDHVANVAALLESSTLAEYYPSLTERAVGKFGNIKGWRRNRLRTASGFTLDALGLDTAARGIKVDDDRPGFIVIDDIDSENDTPLTTEKRIRALTKKVLPAGAQNLAVLAVQNLVHPDSVFAQLVDGRADFLADRQMIGPIPAITDLTYEAHDGRWILTGGTPTWAGQGLARCQEMVNDFGLEAFLSECQHEVEILAGGMFQREWFPIVDAVPASARRLRFWDKAATAPHRANADPDWTRGARVSMTADRLIYIEDIASIRADPGGVEALIAQTAAMDGRGVAVRMEQEPGSSGKDVIDHYVRDVLQGYNIEGIRSTGSKTERAGPVSSQAKVGNIRLVRGDWNKDFLDEMVKFPLGKHDDQCFVAGTLVQTETGERPIETIRVGEMVCTPMGMRTVIASGKTSDAARVVRVELTDGRSTVGTGNHPVFTRNRGFVRLDAVTGADIIETWEQRRSSLMASSFGGIQTQRMSRTVATIGPALRMLNGAFSRCIRKFGKVFMARFLMGARFTTMIGIGTITTPRISLASLRPSTNSDMLGSIEHQNNWRTSHGFSLARLSGISQKRGVNGTGSTESAHGRIRLLLNARANSVASPICLSIIARLINSVRGYVRSAHAWHQGGARRLRKPASIAARGSSLTGTRYDSVPVRVRRVLALPDLRPVYNLTVADAHEYYAGGIRVHNCDAVSGALAFLAPPVRSRRPYSF